MQFVYSRTADALYIEFVTDAIVDRTEQLDNGTLVDLDAGGRVTGIEILQPARLWPVEDTIRQFRIDDEDAALLRDMWAFDEPSRPRQYPYTDEMRFATG